MAKEKIYPTQAEYTMLGNLVDDATEILKGCGIKAVSGCHYDFHTKKAFGIAMRKTNTITINYYFFKACIKNNAISQLQNTMVHEMLHIIVNQIDPKAGHTGLWRKLALQVSNQTDHNITRLATVEKVQLKNEVKPPKYTIVCEDCGKEYYYQRDCSVVHQARTNSPLISCGKCHGKLKLKK